MPHCKSCDNHFPFKVTIDGRLHKFSTRRYCLTCSPLGSRKGALTEELRSKQSVDVDGGYLCRLCDKNCGRRRRLCNTCVSRIRRYIAKKAAVEYLGGKCNKCGWNEDIAALEFHHPNDDKTFEIGDVANRAWSVIVKELDKCELICSNCHRVHHRGVRDEKFFLVVAEYSGAISNKGV